ncbi:MAG TPA: flagellar biosynthesis anti-sigma factor FlgM [Pirellulales bacterium]|jgi:flagellar biosynthesis anti-sigma factor FlgM|nr:flagellar biosynthesis anti-sigma factor FlgM [Pirellulales bacterium]
MQIYGATQLHGAQAVNAPHTTARSSASSTAGSSVSDQLDISPAGQMLDKMNQLPDIRQDRVSQIRASIAAGTYETDDKLGAAVSNLLDEIG